MADASFKVKLTFQQICLSHLKSILEISSHELKKMSTKRIINGFIEETSSEDLRFSYCEAVMNFAFVLSPHFDDTAKEIYKKEFKILNSFNYELKKDLVVELKEAGLDSNSEKEIEFLVGMRLRSARGLFIALNQLLKRSDYLKETFYSEQEDD